MDDFEMEVSPTDTGQQRSVRAPRRPCVRRPPRGVMVGLIAACVVLVTAGLALASVPNLSGRVNVLLHGTPTATPRILPGGNLLYVENAAPWGKLTIDGAQVTLVTTNSQVGHFLKRGTHRVTYQADPFPMLHCRLSVPASTADTCPLDKAYSFPALPPGLQNYAARALSLTPTLDALPSAARTDLMQMISAYVGVHSSATVQPGERYVDASHQIVYANQQLTATFTQALATGATPTSNGCAAVCMPAPDNSLTPSEVASFIVDAHMTQSFSYATAAGQTILADAPTTADKAIPNDEVLPLAMTWNGGWQIAPGTGVSPSTLACAAGANALMPYFVDPRTQYQAYYAAAEVPAANPADGCVYRITGDGAYAGTPTADFYLHIFYRFGVVMVLNTTHDVTWADYGYLLKNLPIADDAETALALQIDASQPYS